MKTTMLFPRVLAVAAMSLSFGAMAQDDLPLDPPAELIADMASAAAPGAIPAKRAPTPAPTAAVSASAAPESVAVTRAPVSAPPQEEIRSVTPVVSTWNSTKATAVVLRSVALRTRPVATGTGDLIAAETRVRLESSTANSDGTWWFVTAPGIGGGWLLEKDIGSPQH